jgi:YebC/PmpR family DNA-binding regulatory protein
MAGHSKWNNIKNRKGAMDAKKGKVFGQLSKLIRMAVKEGKSDNPKFNPSLRLILDKARAANMPKENINRAIERGMGKTAGGASIQETTYEAFGPGGVAMLIAAVTDNPNRTSSEVKHALSKGGGSLSGPGSAMYLFERDQESGEYRPTMEMEVSFDHLSALGKLHDALLEIEDVEEVYLAVDLPEEEDGN